MNDAFGHELRLGDEVIYAHVGYGGSSVVMKKSVIVGFTPKMVRILAADARPGAGSTNVLSRNLIWYPEDAVKKEAERRA